tara:strand:+ start:1044 stop:1454 length:411 start_codon:yes stop_codon:yes gene_type:complete
MCDKKNESLFSAISNLSFSMFSAFWFVYFIFGEKALYGKYEPLLYELYADHLFIPISTITIAILTNCYTNPKENTKYTIILGLVWVLFTLYSGPAYPFLRDSNKGMNIPKLSLMVVCFGSIAVAFDYICCKKKHEK